MVIEVQMRRVARKMFYARNLDRGSSRGGEIRWADPYSSVFSRTFILYFLSVMVWYG